MSEENSGAAIANRIMGTILAIIATLAIVMGGAHWWDVHRLNAAVEESKRISRALTEAVCYPVTKEYELDNWELMYKQERAEISARTDLESKPFLTLDCTRFDEQGDPHTFMASQFYWRPKYRDQTPAKRGT